MPWSRSKCPLCKGRKEYFAWQLIPDRPPASADVRTWGDPITCDCEVNSRKAKELRADWMKNGPDNRLFDDCYRIQREALIATGYICEACGAPDEPRIEMTAPAGHVYEDDLAEYAPCSECCHKSKRYIPILIENVRGAIPWVGKRDMPLEDWNRLDQVQRIKLGEPAARFGSFMLFGDVGHIGKRVIAGRDLADIRAGRGRFGMGVAPERGDLKGHGSTWFGIQSNGDTYDQREVNPVSGQKRNPDGTDHPKGSWFGIADSSQGDRRRVKVSGQIQGQEYAMCRTGAAGQKTLGHVNKRDGHGHTQHLTNQAESDAVREAVKIGGDWFSKEDGGASARFSSKSNARKAASALIAVIPKALSDYIAAQHWPVELSKTARTG